MIRRFQNTSIATKLSFLTVLAVSVSLAICCMVFLYGDMHTLRSAKARQIEALATVLAENTVSALEFQDREAAAATLASLRRQPGIESAVIYDAKGRVFATYPGETPDREPSQLAHKSLKATVPIRPRGDVAPAIFDLDHLLSSEEVPSATDLGRIEVVAGTDDISGQITRRAGVAAVVLIAAMLSGVGISHYFHRVITAPVNDLVRTARYIAERKDYSCRATKFGKDELGELADAFNTMLAELQAGRERLQQAHDELELRVKQRTTELRKANAELQREMAERAALQQELVTASRQAGMAEIATGVLHNVGNVLNSINVSADILMQSLHNSRIRTLTKTAAVIDEHRDRLPEFLSSDERGKHFPKLFTELAASLAQERERQLEEIRALVSHVGHVKEIVNMQQMYARARGTIEPVDMVELMEAALKINEAALVRHQIRVERRFASVAPIISEKHRVLQILINLISNAHHALRTCDRHDKTLSLTIEAEASGVRIEVRDNGVGIPAENLTKIFTHGFTTRKDGHGFGLHSSALSAQELGGSLSAASDGPGRGATFTLHLPAHHETPSQCEI